MPAQWTGKLIGEMHIARITAKQLAEHLNLTREYVSMVLNGHRNPSGAEERFRKALDDLITEKASADTAKEDTHE